MACTPVLPCEWILQKLLSSLGPKDEEGRRHVGVALAQALVDQGACVCVLVGALVSVILPYPPLCVPPFAIICVDLVLMKTVCARWCVQAS